VSRCQRCDAEISRQETTCPECGYDPGSAVRRFGLGLVIFGGAFAFVSPPIGLFGVFTGIVAIGGSYLFTPTG